MTLPSPSPIALDRWATHVDVEPGGEIVLRGAYHSQHDGSIVDAATTTWPAGAPGGASVDAGGLFDLEAGGFHVISRDPVRHEVHAVATGAPAPACAALGTTSPCVPLRLQKQALSRLLTVEAWARSLQAGGGQVTLEVPEPSPLRTPPAAVPYLGVAGGLIAAGVVAIFAARRHARHAASPDGQLAGLFERVQSKLGRADPVLAAPLMPAVATARRALRRVDARSAEGERVAAALLRVEARLDASAHRIRADAEQQAADELVHEMEGALEAADEATLAQRV